MSDDKTDASKVDDSKEEAELAESELGGVAGGLNPQPEPPGKLKDGNG